MSVMLPAGTILQNRYRIVRAIAQGGMGRVYEAKHMVLPGVTLALKETLFTDEHLREQFEREAYLLATLHHPALPRVTDYFTEGNGLFLVMQFIPGNTLAQMMLANGKPFPPAKVLEWGDQLLDALDYLHTQERPIIHRDIKPENLKLTSRGQIILLDFGIAEVLNPQAHVSDGIIAYTLHYASPEQMQGKSGPRSDLFSLGATLYRLMTGERPPSANMRSTSVSNKLPDPLRPANELNTSIPPAISHLLNRAMALDPSQRPSTAAEMRAALNSPTVGKLRATLTSLLTNLTTGSRSNEAMTASQRVLTHRPLRVFLCHASEDKAAVRTLYRRLRTNGVVPWLDEEDLIAGQDWESQIRKAVRDTDVVLACLSPQAVSKKGFVQREIKLSLDVADEQPEDTIFIIPVKLSECDVPERLRRWHWVNLYEEQGYERLLRALQERAGRLQDGTAKPSVKTVLPPRAQIATSSNGDSKAILNVIDCKTFGVSLSPSGRLSKANDAEQVATVEFYREPDNASLPWIEVRANVEFYNLNGKRLARVNDGFWYKEHEELTQLAKFKVGDSKHIVIAINTRGETVAFNGHVSTHRVVTTHLNEFIPDFEELLEVKEAFVRVRLLSTRGGRTVLDEAFDFKLNTEPTFSIEPHEEGRE